MQALLGSLTPAERRAVALVGLMIRMHGGIDGEGLFSGVARYSVLSDRLSLAAERCRDVRSLWDIAASSLRWSIGAQKFDDAVLTLIAPADTDGDVLRALAERTQAVVMIARRLARQERDARQGCDEPAPVEAPALNDFVDDPLDIFLRAVDDPEPAKPAPADTKPTDQTSLF